MPFYKVTWVIELDADTPRKAAEMAMDIQQGRIEWGKTATVFEVEELPSHKRTTIDLLPEGIGLYRTIAEILKLKP